MRNLKGWRGDISHQESREKEKKKEREGALNSLMIID